MTTTAAISAFILPILAVGGIVYIFVLWVMWMIVKSLKGIDASVREIARNTQVKI